MCLAFAIWLAAYLLQAIPLFAYARRTRLAHAWLALVPGGQWPLFAAILLQEDEPKWALGIAMAMLSMIPFVPNLEYALAWGEAAENAGQSTWLGYLCGVPGLLLVLPWVIALRTPRNTKAVASPPAPRPAGVPVSLEPELTRAELLEVGLSVRSM